MTKGYTNRQGGGQKLNRLRRKVGAILIEFAFAIPVFLVLIYYIHDLPKQKLMQRKMQFVAYEMAAILQNMAKQKVITRADIQNAMRLASLSVFPGTTQYGTGSGGLQAHYLPLGYMPHFFTYYVKGTEENKAQVKWMIITYSINPSISESGSGIEIPQSVYKHRATSVNPLATDAHSIHPALKISNNEVKIIVEAVLHYAKDSNRFFSDGRHTSSVSAGKAFNFLMLSPKSCGSGNVGYFNSVAIFAPVTGSFSEKPPQ